MDNIEYFLFFGEYVLVGWKNVIEMVYVVGGKMMFQIWYIGFICRFGIGLNLDVFLVLFLGLVVFGKKVFEVLLIVEIEILV